MAKAVSGTGEIYRLRAVHRRLRGRVLGRNDSDPAAEDYQIALDAIEFRDARQMPPGREAEVAKQRETRFIVPEDETEQRVEAELGRALHRRGNQLTRIAAPTRIRRDIDAQFRRRMIGGASIEGLEAEPSGNGAIFFDDPQWTRIRRMLPEPCSPRIDADRLEVGGREAAGNR